MFIAFILTGLGNAVGVQTSVVLLTLQNNWVFVALGVCKILLEFFFWAEKGSQLGRTCKNKLPFSSGAQKPRNYPSCFFYCCLSISWSLENFFAVDQLHSWVAGSMGSSEKQHTQLLQVWRRNRVWLQRLYLSEQGWDYSKYNFIIAIIHVWGAMYLYLVKANTGMANSIRLSTYDI